MAITDVGLKPSEITCLKSNIPLLIAVTASRALLPLVKASQMLETEGRNSLLDNEGDGA